MNKHQLQLVGISLFGLFLLVVSGLSGVAFGSSGQATFSGTATIHLVGKDASGNVVNVMLTGVSFSASVNAGGPGVGTSTMFLPSVPGMTEIPGTVATGQVKMSDGRASGGGTLSIPGMAGSQFAFSVGTNGGQFHCLMAGFSAGFPYPPAGLVQVLQMDVRGTVPAGALVVG